MTEHILLLTGKLAEPTLHKVMQSLEQPLDFSYEIRQLGVSVAALMTTDMVRRRLDAVEGVDRVLLPGRCRGDLQALAGALGVPVERGPKELKDLPGFFGRQGAQPDLSRHDIRIFAEIVEAPAMSVQQICAQAAAYRRDGADVIDLGFLPATPFPHLEESIAALGAEGFEVSVDSLEPDDLLRGARAGASYLLSLSEDTLEVARRCDAVPVLVPSPDGGMASLYRAIDALLAEGRPFIADAILEPVHFGFTRSLVRYHELRERYPSIEIMIGTGNLTELTDADTTGVSAVIMGVASELHASHVLTTQVSRHCRNVVRETDVARRMLYAAREQNALPQGLHDGLLALRDKRPFPYSGEEILETARAIRDPSYRVQTGEEGLYVFNRDGVHTALDPFELYPSLGVETDGAHAFYLGVELARAQIAWQLGKRYAQDEELRWGCAVAEPVEDLDEYRRPGTTCHNPGRTETGE